jgi:hypothetical protein
MTSVAFVTGSQKRPMSTLALGRERVKAFPMKPRKVYMSGHNLRATLPLSIAMLGLAAAPSAQAASTRVSVHAHSGDRSTLKVSNVRARDWKRQHVGEKVLRPATHSGKMSHYPQSSGTWNFAKATGSLSYSGAIRIRDGKHSITLTKLHFTRTAKDKSSVTARIGNRTVKLLTLTGRTHVKRQGARETLSGFTAHLTKQAARRIDTRLKHRVLSNNESLGSFAISVSNSTATKSPPIKPSGTVGFNLSPDLAQALVADGFGALPIAPATLAGLDGSSITLPDVVGSGGGSSFNAGTLTGSVPLGGGLQLGSGTAAVTLTNPKLTLGTGTEGSSLSFAVDGGPEVKLFDVDTSALEQSTTANGELSLTGLIATVSRQGAATLNALAGKDIVTPAETAGGLTVIAPA